MPTVFTRDDTHEFERCVVKRNGYVVGIDGRDSGVVKSHYPPDQITEIEGEVSYER